ncbi:CAF17-like 4Fe-4S cluster assembly/insertion protein YgfZ [Ferrovibrio xuzhouensis]|uniref:YgfZ/GcvT domain-containing protein n=1 Tax=Ferrovibrio xuzhouensis TaxID=1576914 RepID=A0ABV7VC96_9PROT
MPDLFCTALPAAGATGRALLRLSGPEAVDFLDALVSNSVAGLAPGRAAYAALLTPQGKFLHDFFVTAAGDGGLLLDVAAERRADLKRRLTLYKLRAKVEIADSDWQGFVLFGSEARPDLPKLLQEAGALLFADPRLAALGWHLWLPPGMAPAARELGMPVPFDAWERHRLILGVPDGMRDIEPEKGILLENHFEALHGVDFTKGCYIGQELTARTKYRGLIKKQLCKVKSTSGDFLPLPGTIVSLDGREAGEMRSSLGGLGLALLRLDALAAAERDGKTLEAAGVAITARRPDYAAALP